MTSAYLAPPTPCDFTLGNDGDNDADDEMAITEVKSRAVLPLSAAWTGFLAWPPQDASLLGLGATGVTDSLVSLALLNPRAAGLGSTKSRDPYTLVKLGCRRLLTKQLVVIRM